MLSYAWFNAIFYRTPPNKTPFQKKKKCNDEENVYKKLWAQCLKLLLIRFFFFGVCDICEVCWVARFVGRICYMSTVHGYKCFSTFVVCSGLRHVVWFIRHCSHSLTNLCLLSASLSAHTQLTQWQYQLLDNHFYYTVLSSLCKILFIHFKRVKITVNDSTSFKV